MRSVKVALAMVALAAPFASAQAAEAVHEVKASMVGDESAAKNDGSALVPNAGWNGSWALLFQLNNPFQNADFIQGFGPTYGPTGLAGGAAAHGGLGFMYMVSQEMAARVGLFAGRATNPVAITKTVSETSGSSVETYSTDAASHSAGNPTSASAFSLRADMLYRLTQAAVAPYLGGGLYYDWVQGAVAYKDDVTDITQVVDVNYRSRTQNIGVRGLLGAEWRLHSNFAIFAEYALSVNVLHHASVHNESTTTLTAVDGTTSARHTLVTSGTPGYFGYASALTNAFQLGLAIHFK